MGMGSMLWYQERNVLGQLVLLAGRRSMRKTEKSARSKERSSKPTKTLNGTIYRGGKKPFSSKHSTSSDNLSTEKPRPEDPRKTLKNLDGELETLLESLAWHLD